MDRHRKYGGEFADHLPFWWEQPDRTYDIVDALTRMSAKSAKTNKAKGS